MTGAADARQRLRAEADAYWEAVRADDLEGALAAVDRAAAGGSPEEALERLVTAAQVRVGELWERGGWSVAQEHSATALSEAVVRHHLSQAQAALPPSSSPVVVACAEREWHALPGLLLAAALARRGLPVVSLGADVSAQRLHGSLLDAPAAAVLVSASLSSSLPRVRAHVETARLVGTPVVVGGRAFDPAGRRAAAIGATAQAGDAAGAADLVRTLPRRVEPAPPLTHEAVGEAVLLEADCGRVVDQVRRLVLDRPEERGAEGPDRAATDRAAADRWHRVLVDQLPHVVGSVAGALLVRDASVVSETRSWFGTVLASRSAPPTTLEDVWQALHRTLHDFPHARDLLERSPAA